MLWQRGGDAFILCSLREAIAMSENMYIEKLILVSNTMRNKSVIKDGVNGYVCETVEEYAEKIKAAMKKFPSELTERAYQDALEIYNTEVMKKKYIGFYNRLMAENTGGYNNEIIVVLWIWNWRFDYSNAADEKAVA